MKILIVTANDGGVEYHRLFSPFRLLTQHEVSITNVLCPETYDLLDEGYDWVVFSRMLCATDEDISAEVLTMVKRSGAKVLVDVDDYWRLHHGHLLEKHWAKMKFQKRTEYALKNADMVWTTHQFLSDRVPNANTHILPNALNPDEAQWQPSKVNGLSIGWFGSAAHERDIDTISQPFRHWRRANPSVQVVSTYSEKHRGTFLRIAAKLGECDLAPAKDVWNYGTMYDMVSVSIAPLADNEFNMCKSELKAIEAGFKGKAFMATKMHPYTLCCDRSNSVLFRPSTLVKSLDRMKESAFREDIAAALSERVRKDYDLRRVNELRDQLLTA
jgi:processive 1,2-diacylglycerol beta-glucosyltransferase